MEEVKKINDAEKKIIEARVEKDRFCELSEEDKKIVAAEVVVIGACITGCNTPNTDNFMDRLCNEIILHISEFGYSELTEDEFYLALRLNAKGGNKFISGLEIDQIQFTGNTFNVDYFSKVLSNYMAMRKQLDRKFENFIDGY